MSQSKARPLPDKQEWYRLTKEQTLAELGTDLEVGLDAEAVRSRLAEYGPNAITSRKGPGHLRRALSQFTQPLILILIAAGAVTAYLQEWVDSGVIFGVVLVNALVGFLQEAKAVKAIEALSRSMVTQAVVLRSGQRVVLSAHDLVPGDVVILQAGDKVPADLRLVQSRDLRVDESTLTGESLPVDKTTDPLDAQTPLADRSNMSYATTLVTAGQAVGVVIATGDGTEVGRISDLITKVQDHQTPLTRKIAQFSKYLLVVILVMAGVTAGVGLLRGEGAVEMFLAAVALAVGAIPEGLPAAVTIVLAIGVSRMAQRRAVIRKLPAVETLGSTTVICSDKTGTLTQNQMTVKRIAVSDAVYEVSGAGYAPEGAIKTNEGASAGNPAAEVLRAGALCNDSSLRQNEGQWQIQGDPTEAALLVSAAKAGLDRAEADRMFPRLDTVPFESQHQYMATLHRTGDKDRVVYVKGAVEKILERCSTQLNADGSVGAADGRQIEAQASSMASEGMRVLAFARKALDAEVDRIVHEDLQEGLVFLGLQGMIDPPRPEAIAAVEACHAAGVQVKMITGDHVLTASAIARQLRLGGLGHAGSELTTISGVQLEALSDEELSEVAEKTHVFARVTPEQKLRLVEALQGRGHVVAMTGDGVNDAPALRQADIGVAMGITGTEVSKEAADMVLTDDNFASIEAAVEEGRGVFDNLTKFIAWTLPTNLGEGLVILAAVFAGVALPILPVQILWINMTTAVLLGLMLAFEPKETGIMQRPPRAPGDPILTRSLIGRVFTVGFLLLVASFGLFEYAVRTGHSLAAARTMAVNVFVFGEMAYLFNCRSLTQASWKSSFFTNKYLFGGVGLMAALQVAYTYVPSMNSLFGSAPMGALGWALVSAAAVVIHAVIELEKALKRRGATRGK